MSFALIWHGSFTDTKYIADNTTNLGYRQQLNDKPQLQQLQSDEQTRSKLLFANPGKHRPAAVQELES